MEELGSLLGRKQSVFNVLPAAVTGSCFLYPLKAAEVHPVHGPVDDDDEPKSMALTPCKGLTASSRGQPQESREHRGPNLPGVS